MRLNSKLLYADLESAPKDKIAIEKAKETFSKLSREEQLKYIEELKKAGDK
ncbi:hypothetical protein KAW50_06510 [candidate division WOR-3 bacterium]|nr:hypothetical protein [candidate division WOR-3 bacterium]